MRRLVLIVSVFALMCAPTANAAEKTLWYDDTYDGIARTISGVSDIRVLMEDDPNVWAANTDPGVLGFVCIYCGPGDGRYHRIFVAPSVATALGLQAHVHWWDTLGNNPAPSRETVFALIAFVHESYHWRLLSTDESRVQACAIRDLPFWLENQFHVPSTVQQTQTVPQEVTRDVRTSYRALKKVKRKGKWVWVWVKRYQWETVTETVYVQQTVTLPNPVYAGVVNAANAIHAAEAPPYSGGTCY